MCSSVCSTGVYVCVVQEYMCVVVLRQSIMAIRGSRSGKKTINIPADFACV